MALRTLTEYEEMRRRRQAAILVATQQVWSQMTDDLDASWARISRRLADLVTASQYGAAQEAAAYVPTALAEQGVESPPLGMVNPAELAGQGTSVDGMLYGDLEGLLYGAVVKARTAPAESLQERLDIGGKHLSSLVFTQVADAGRMAAETEVAARPKTGWIRQVNPPCCKRCAVLAGKWFKHNEGFDRHPECDCTHIPWAEDVPDNPGTVIGPEDVKDLNKAERKVIAAGADMNQVINASRKGAKSDDGMFTREGTTKGGFYGELRQEIDRQRNESTEFETTSTGRRGAVPNYRVRKTRKRRLTPHAIVRHAKNDEELYRMLAQNGYLLRIAPLDGSGGGRTLEDIARIANGG